MEYPNGLDRGMAGGIAPDEHIPGNRRWVGSFVNKCSCIVQVLEGGQSVQINKLSKQKRILGKTKNLQLSLDLRELFSGSTKAQE